ncbi:MAG TPA: hypothetical protein VIK45_04515 [Candidatus Dormibacteraeota bacterium]
MALRPFDPVFTTRDGKDESFIVIPPFCGHRSGKGRSDVRVLDIAPEGSNRYLAPVLRNILTRLVPTRYASGVIYGTLVTAGAIVTASEAAPNVVEMAITVVVTVALYWVAHAYAEVVGNSQAIAPSLKVAVRELALESPMVAACILPLAVLLATDLVGASFELATTISLLATVGLLLIWGLLAARRARLNRAWAAASGAVYTLLGVAIVGLKLILVH